jgi:hypothetical protein
MRHVTLFLFLFVVAVGCGKKAEQTSPPAEDKPLSDAEKEALRDRVAKLKGDKERPTPTVKGGVPEATSKPEPKVEPKADVKYAGMNEWVQVGDLRVRLTKAAVKKVPLISSFGGSDRKYESKDPELMVWVEIENLSKTKKVLYSRWGASGFDRRSQVEDEHGNKYSLSPYDGSLSGRVEGGLEYSTKDIRPGDPVLTDIVCVERPIDAATEVRLTLNGLPSSEKETFRFKIRAADWK